MILRNFIGLSALGLIGCANGVSGLRPLTYAQPAETRTLVSFIDCENYTPDGQQFGPVGAAILLGAASKVLDNFGTALSNASAGGQLPASTSTANFESPAGILPKCIMIIRGNFGGKGNEGSQQVEGAWRVYDTTNGFIDVEMPYVRDLHHHVELQLMPSKDNSALTFAPVYSEIKKSMDGTKKANKSRDMSIALAFSRPSQKDTGGVVVLTDRKIGMPVTYSASNGRFMYEAPWFGTFSPKSATGDTARTKPIAVTVKATVVETRPSREFLAFVASVFNDAAKPAINAQLKNTFDPATVATADKAAFDGAAAYASAYGNAVNNLVKYCALVATDDIKAERASSSAAARSAQINANKVAYNADLKAPFLEKDLVKVSLNAITDSNASACTNY